MDWDLAIRKNREGLKRVVAALVAMSGLGDWPISPLEGEMSAKPTEGGIAPSRETPPSALPGISPSRGAIALTLPRYLRLAVLRLLRPAEAAARRLIVIAARGLVVALPPPRPRKPDLKADHAGLRRLGIAVVAPACAASASRWWRRPARRRRAGPPDLWPGADQRRPACPRCR